MPCFVRIVPALFFIVTLSVPAAAEDNHNSLDSLEQLMSTEVTTVTGASKYQQELTDAPSSVSIITSDYGSSRLNAAREKVAGAAIVNLTLLNLDLIKGLDVTTSLYNLFDTRYAMPASSNQINSLGETLQSISQDGLTFRIKVTYRS